MTKLRTANLLAAVATEVSGRTERSLKRHHSQTSSSAAALNVIGFWEGCSNLELSRILGLSHTATLRAVDKLEGDGLVRCQVGRDRRTTSLSLTEQGRLQAQAMLQERCVAVAPLIDLLSLEEQSVFSPLLEKLLKGLVSDEMAAGRICRLCDESSCPADTCPVHAKLEEIEKLAIAEAAPVAACGVEADVDE